MHAVNCWDMVDTITDAGGHGESPMCDPDRESPPHLHALQHA